MVSARFCYTLAKSIPAWLLKEGPHHDTIISTRVRLARNLAGYPFPAVASADDRSDINAQIREAVAHLPHLQDPRVVDMTKLNRLDRRVLLERRLASPAFVERKGPAMLVLSEGEFLSIMVNEEDHLRIQSIQPGLGIAEAWQAISVLDDELGDRVDYAYSDRFGYLTACPTNTGTGLRVSILIHLPSLIMLDEIENTIRRFSPAGITVRGFYGEGSKVIGNIFQISNQHTLGRTESSVIKLVEEVAHRFLDLEREGRERLLLTRRAQLEDQIWRAYGTLCYARILSSTEFLNLLSLIRLGLDLEILPQWPRVLLNELMIMTQPGHLQKTHKHTRSAESRDLLRAKILFALANFDHALAWAEAQAIQGQEQSETCAAQ